MKLIATKSFPYRTRRLQPGEGFVASDQHGRQLIGIKLAKADDTPPQSAPAAQGSTSSGAGQERAKQDAASDAARDAAGVASGAATAPASGRPDEPKDPTARTVRSKRED